MTEPPYDEQTLAQVLRIYADAPMNEGDAALLLDHKLCVEVERLALEWDTELCENTAYILREATKSVIVAIARPGARLLPQDVQLWRELHDELRGSDVDLQPLRALPAA
ncbi:MAG: hypothetical protein QOE05_202 [Actinomycetota bacterium]|nr:hypothetical protein [Actinomycetota bacterium]